jgi:hypothetical protein
MRRSNITKNHTRVPLLLVLAASIIGLAPALSLSAWAGSGSYSINDVSGDYIDHGDGYYLGPGGTNGINFIPVTWLGLVTFTPAAGTFHEDVLSRSAGINSEHLIDGTYSVNETGHGVMTWRNGAKRRDFYIVNGGAELKALYTDPPGTNFANQGGTMTKQ